MKKNQGLIILLLIVLFLYLKPSTYASPPPVVPIKYKLIQGGKLPELAPVPKSNKLLTNYRNTMQNFLDALEKSYVTTPEAITYVKNSSTYNITYINSLVRNFIAQHNAYFKAQPTTDVCSWVMGVLGLTEIASSISYLYILYPEDPGLKSLKVYTPNSSSFIIYLGDNISSRFGGSC